MDPEHPFGEWMVPDFDSEFGRELGEEMEYLDPLNRERLLWLCILMALTIQGSHCCTECALTGISVVLKYEQCRSSTNTTKMVVFKNIQ